MQGMPSMEYPTPTGYQPLVEFLEAKYKAPVIITNGAKQALGATCYALKRMGKKSIGMRNPYWALIPPLVQMHGMKSVFQYEGADAALCLLPNNPDGWSGDPAALEAECKKHNTPLIHDAVYYSHVYLPRSRELKPFGDVQIYSASKAFGLSGLRIGWVVCPNPEFYQYIQEYMEAMTVGVSIMPQVFLESLLKAMQDNPQQTEEFEMQAADALSASKQIIWHLDREVLEVPTNIHVTPGMFGLFRIPDPSILERAKIHAIDGKYFGAPGFIRMNLAFDTVTMNEIVNRLNNAKIKR